MTTQSSLLSDLKNLAGKSSIYGLGALSLRAISFLLLPLYTRFLTPADYGTLAVANLIYSILFIVLPLSLHGALNPIYFFTSNEHERAKGLGTIWLAIVLLAGGMAILLDQAGSILFPSLFRNVPFIPYIRLAIWTAFCATLGLVPLNLLQMQERAKSYVLLTASGTLLQIGSVIYLVVVQKRGAEGYLQGNFLAALLMALPFVILALRNVHPTLQWGVLKSGLAYSLPLLPHLLAGWVLELADRVILEHFVSLDELGLYSLGYTYGTVMSMIATAINSAWVPFLFKTDVEKGQSARERLARLGTYYTLFLSLVALTLGIFAKEIIQVMTASPFHEAYRVAPWIVAGGLLGGLYYFPINFLFLKRKTSLVPIVTVVSGLFNVVLNLWLVPHFGILASAWATCLSYGLMAILAWRVALHTYPLQYEYIRLAKIGLTVICLLVAGSTLPFTNLSVAVLIKVGLILAFPAILTLLRFWTPSEREQVSSLVSVFRLWISQRPR